MTAEKLLEVISKYRREFERCETPKWKFPFDQKPASPKHKMAHCHSMLDEMEAFIKEGKIEKTMRWLGFIQGCFWTDGYNTLDELRADNSP